MRREQIRLNRNSAISDKKQKQRGLHLLLCNLLGHSAKADTKSWESYFLQAYIRDLACNAFQYQATRRKPRARVIPLPQLPWPQCGATSPHMKPASKKATTALLGTRWPS